MNREIKFRVWDKKSKEIYFPRDEVQFMDGVPFFADTDFLIPMQFTGLKDKNGKDIFEGDIIKVKDGTLWLVEEIGSKSTDGEIGICVSPIHFKKTYLIDDSILSGKVIGNIYENPELLEKKQ